MTNRLAPRVGLPHHAPRHAEWHAFRMTRSRTPFFLLQKGKGFGGLLSSGSIIQTLTDRLITPFGEAPGCPAWPTDSASRLLDGREGQPISRIEPLVAKLTETQVAGLESRFSGSGDRERVGIYLLV